MRPGRLTVGRGTFDGYARPLDCDPRALNGHVSASNSHACGPNGDSGSTNSHTAADGDAKPNGHSGSTNSHIGADGDAKPNGDPGSHTHEH